MLPSRTQLWLAQENLRAFEHCLEGQRLRWAVLGTKTKVASDQASADLEQGVQVEDATKYIWTIGEYRCPL